MFEEIRTTLELIFTHSYYQIALNAKYLKQTPCYHDEDSIPEMRVWSTLLIEPDSEVVNLNSRSLVLHRTWGASLPMAHVSSSTTDFGCFVSCFKSIKTVIFGDFCNPFCLQFVCVNIKPSHFNL